MFEIYIEDHFNAAHYLRNYEGDCSKLHGHSYKVGMTFRFEKQNENGVAFDFISAKKIINEIISVLDHSCLNELDYFRINNPTAENISYYIFCCLKKKVSQLYSVSVWESDKTCATYYE